MEDTIAGGWAVLERIERNKGRTPEQIAEAKRFYFAGAACMWHAFTALSKQKPPNPLALMALSKSIEHGLTDAVKAQAVTQAKTTQRH